MEHFELSMQIALKIKARLRQLRLKHKEFALMAKAQPSEVNRWLSGYHNFTIKTLLHIQNVLGINFFNFDSQASHSIPCLPCEFAIITTKP